MIFSIIIFVLLPALLCAGAFSWWVNDWFVLHNLSNVVPIVIFFVYMVCFLITWGIIYVIVSTKNVKECIAELGVFISGIVCLTAFLKNSDFPNSYVVGGISFVCMFFCAVIYMSLPLEKRPKLEKTEKITKLSEEFPVLFTWAYVELHILCLKENKNKAIQFAVNMKQLGWLDEVREQWIIYQYGDIFSSENMNYPQKNIQLYALKELMLFLYGQDPLSEEDKEELNQLFKEMKKLGWIKDTTLNKKQKERLSQMGIDIEN
jgi:hypothetical protein